MNSHQWQQHVTISFQTVVQESLHFLSCLEEIPSTSLTCYCMQLDAIFHDDNGFPNLKALENIYQVVAQQLLNSRERYVKKHHSQQ